MMALKAWLCRVARKAGIFWFCHLEVCTNWTRLLLNTCALLWFLCCPMLGHAGWIRTAASSTAAYAVIKYSATSSCQGPTVWNKTVPMHCQLLVPGARHKNHQCVWKLAYQCVFHDTHTTNQLLTCLWVPTLLGGDLLVLGIQHNSAFQRWLLLEKKMVVVQRLFKGTKWHS